MTFLELSNAQKHDYIWTLGTGNTLVDSVHGGTDIDFNYSPPQVRYIDRATKYNGLFAVDVGFGKTFLRCKPTREFSSDKGITYLIEFNAAYASHIIKFTNWGHIYPRYSELVLDNVRLYTLAELSKSVTPCVTETNDLDEDFSISLYPNPFLNELIVKSDNLNPKELILYDITSSKILQNEFTNSFSINTEQLAKGIYIYEVREKYGVLAYGKVVKE